MASPNWLTCDLVEELQQAVTQGRLSILSSVHWNTRRCRGFSNTGSAEVALPKAPSTTGSNFLCPSDGHFKKSGRNWVCGPREPKAAAPYHHARGPRVLRALGKRHADDGQDWGEFPVRFRRQSVKSVGFSLEKAKGIAAALGEMADNAIIHASASVGVLIGYHVIDGAAVSCVADVGMGVLASLTTHSAYRNVQTHKEAVRLALRRGVSRFGPGHGGLGFYNVFKALTAMSGTLRFRSGEGCVMMDGTDFEADHGEESFVIFRPGFQVTICVRSSDHKDSFPLI